MSQAKFKTARDRIAAEKKHLKCDEDGAIYQDRGRVRASGKRIFRAVRDALASGNPTETPVLDYWWNEFGKVSFSLQRDFYCVKILFVDEMANNGTQSVALVREALALVEKILDEAEEIMLAAKPTAKNKAVQRKKQPTT